MKIPVLLALVLFITRPLDIIHAQCWKTVQTGANHCIAIKNDGTLWSWGNSSNGQIGNGGTSDVLTPYQIGWANDWQSVATGRSSTHNLAIKNDGTLWSWGYNFYGQLGYDAGVDYSVPTQVGTDTTWSKVACGMFYSLAIKKDSTLWGWGSNAYGQVNTNISSQFVLEPTMISLDSNWAEISCGDAHNLALTTTGALYAWGFNNYGAVGNGNNIESSLVQIASDQTWISIAAGDSHSLAVRSDHTLWSWGYSSNGQLGNGVLYSTTNIPVQVGSDTDWAQVFSGEFFSLGIKTDGTLWAWGENGYGELGIGNNEQQPTPVQVGTDTNWKAVQGGRQHTIGLKDDDSAMTWGRNEYGTLGNGTYASDGTFLHVYSNVPVDLLCGPVNIDEPDTERVLSIYPNPASERINLIVPEGVQKAYVEIFDAMGSLVYASELHDSTVNVEALTAGSYFIFVTTESWRTGGMFVID